MDILAQLAANRAQQAQLKGLEEKETQLLLAYAAQHRRYPDGQPCIWRERPCIIDGPAIGYYTDADFNVGIAYGVILQDGQAFDSVTESNIMPASAIVHA